MTEQPPIGPNRPNNRGGQPWQPQPPQRPQQPTYQQPAYQPPPAPRPPAKVRPGAGFTTGLLLTALVLGGAAGLGGAWGYDEFLADDKSDSQPRASDGSEVDPSALDTSKLNPLDIVSVNDVSKAVLPTVVKITAIGESGSGGTGSGVILTEDGEILTNDHVVAPAADGGELTVSFDNGKLAEAELIGTDPLTDTALIKAKDVSDLPTAKVGSSDKTEVGQAVVAVGSPYGLEATVTAGIVSALHRPILMPLEDDPDKRSVYGAIQTDAAINPGNSGGALVNMIGELVGMNSSIELARGSNGAGGDLGSIGIGYAIPIDDVMPIIEQLRDGDDPTHAKLGVVADNAVNVGGVPNGAIITDVGADTAAEEAGLKEDDVITSVGGIHTGSRDSLIATIYSFRPDEEAEVVLVRDGEEKTVTVTFASD